MTLRHWLAGVGLGLSMSINHASATPVSFFDGVFNDSDWTGSVIYQYGPPDTVSFTAQQVATGGNPNQFRWLQHTYGGPGGIRTGHLRTGAVYDPGTLGAVGTIDFSFDIELLDGGDSLTVDYAALIKQGDSYYVSNFVHTTITPTTGIWVSHSLTGLIATDFIKVVGSGPLNPDFSPSGSPLEFGYAASNGTAAYRPTSTQSGIDNWAVTVRPASTAAVPEPGSVVLLTVGLVALLYTRRWLPVYSDARQQTENIAAGSLTNAGG